MNKNIKIISLNEENLSIYVKGVSCLINPREEGVQKKIKWLKERFPEGLRVKLLYNEENKKVVGFIEYTAGEYAWRAIEASNHIFIHCIWIHAKKDQMNGLGSILIAESVRDAREEKKDGVVAISSEGAFMTGKNLFLRNGFISIAEAKPSFNLMVKSLKKASLPKFKDYELQLKKYKGLHIVYSNQCPWVARSIDTLRMTATKEGLNIQINEIKNAREAQDAPSIYAVFNLINNGKILADHYISQRRFQNIINKERKNE
ncbi:GNAT family N-acetyltransferase [bacterium]|nr:GNAT family N-acetyltransferase [bacterium]